MNGPEMMRLMGMNPTEFTLDVTLPQVAKQVGNAMSLNVIERIIYNILPAAGFGKNNNEDRWTSSRAMEEIKASRNRGFRKEHTSAKESGRDKDVESHEFIWYTSTPVFRFYIQNPEYVKSTKMG